MSVCRLFKCECGKQSYVPDAPKEVTQIPCSCGRLMRMLPNWYVTYSVAGKKKVEAVSPSRRQAEAVFRKRVIQAKEGHFFVKIAPVPWDHGVARLTKFLQTAGVNTRRMHENSLVALSAFFGGQRVGDISPALVDRFKALRAAKVTSSTINRELATLKKIVALCMENGDLIKNPIEWVRPLKENPSRDRVLTEEEYERLLNACGTNPRLFLAVSIVSQTGLRKHGVYTLSWRDVHFEGKYIDKVVKGGKKVAIPMTEMLYDLLLAEKEMSESEWVLPSPESQNLHVSMNSNLGFPEACKRAEIEDFRFHDLRHSFATLFVIRTGDKEACRVILGHSKSATTDKYVNIPDSHIRESMKKFEENK